MGSKENLCCPAGENTFSLALVYVVSRKFRTLVASMPVPQKGLGGDGEVNKSAAVKSGKLDPKKLWED